MDDPQVPEWLQEYACNQSQACSLRPGHICEVRYSGRRRWVCTKTKGHDGPHVACGGQHNLAIWDDGNIAWEPS